MNRIIALCSLCILFGWSVRAQESNSCPGPNPVQEYCFCDNLSLDGDWEMAYSPHFLEVNTYPDFRGKPVKGAIPGYWEDMVPAFRAAGIDDEFRINPEYTERSLPQVGWAPDTQLPQPYGTFFYRRTINLPSARDAVLSFEGVRNEVRVWVNRQFVAFRQGYSTPFAIAVPADFLKAGENEITLAVANSLNRGYAGGDVRGLTSRALFRATGGVNGHLALGFPRNDLHDIAVTTAEDLSSFTIRVNGRTPYRYAVLDGESVLARGEGCGDTTLSTRGFEFWSPENPKRYVLEVKAKEDVSFRMPFGLRRLTAKGTRLLLNGKPAYLRGVTEHCYFPTTVHLPRDIGYYRMITRKRKELGFNFVRFHTFVPPVEYLEAADELGMMIEMESPNYVPESEFAAIIAFARRHPSVVMYSTGNETRIDRLAEVYLNEIADMVHSRTDSLFTPMSALRGVSYYVFKDVEPVVEKPYPHNEERARRLAQFCDLFHSYSLGATSYNYLDGPSAAEVDSWVPFYSGKPRLMHESCIDGTYADLGLEAMYPNDSPIVKTKLFSEVRRVLTEKGLVDRAGVYFTNSCAWVSLVRKYGFEKTRAMKTVSGFDFLGDINTHWHTYGYSVGMMDEFYRLKPCETVENVLRYNSAAVLLCDFGTDFNLTAGERRSVTFSLSNYDRVFVRPELTADLMNERGEVVAAFRSELPDLPADGLSTLGCHDYLIPADDVPRQYRLKASLAVAGRVVCANEWCVYAFPRVEAPSSVMTDISRNDLIAAMKAGERVLLLGKGPFKTSPMTFNAGRAGRCSGNFATVIDTRHPIFEDFPNDGYCGWQFRRLMDHAAAVQVEADIPFDPIVDVASAVKCPIRQGALLEYRVGRGRLLVSTFNFQPTDPAAVFLKARLVQYAASERFEPRLAISTDDLAKWLDTPAVETAGNPNRAMNPGDPSSYVRTGENLMP